MIAYKFLAERSLGPFTGFAYVRGTWVDAVVDLARGAGIHACRARDLPYWVDAELWRIELAGETHELETQIVASRARLVDRIDVWNARAFAGVCAERTRQRVEMAVRSGADAALTGYAIDAARFAALGNAGAAAYIAAVAADAIDGGFARERASQAALLVESLGLDENSPVAV